MNEPSRQQRLTIKTQGEARQEYAAAADWLRQRPDYHQVFDYFLEIAGQAWTAAEVSERTGRPVVQHLCNQAPLEIFHAMGLQPLRLASGCCAVSRLAEAGLPALMCPMLRSAIGAQRVQAQASRVLARVIPTTCDWTVKFQELAVALPNDLQKNSSSPPVHLLELPHQRHSERGQARFQEELFLLIDFLEQKIGRRLTRSALLTSVNLYREAWAVLESLIALRRDGRLAAAWFAAICAAFLFDSIERWLTAAQTLVSYLQNQKVRPAARSVFLCGSPIIFPNLKLLRLIEEAKMYVAADELCASERLWPGGMAVDDRSVSGLIRALAGRYHRACQCPTFADNERRFNSVRAVGLPLKGIIYHVLKGCHPFDIESLTMERMAREANIPFIRIETEYSPEDARTILTRLEAFANIDHGASA
ncbi:MAG: 2-hydroxyacyl-CoA dehydratase family protein [Desulfobulbaceae bacterium]|jgi:benzoyl-CoA reductase/2-hydroxyglutaryl-CoA dehydratase subunit BcrC/BadD/HgdB|nr:2-hydroxyacyl-CoA dehydratase family protein [Desulfobulbaceae bacterium]